MAWFGRFLAGIFAGSTAIGVLLAAVIVVADGGGMTRLREGLARVFQYDGAADPSRDLPKQIPTDIATPPAGDAPQGETIAEAFAQSLAFLDPDKRGEALGQMHSIRPRPGETPEQAIQRELENWAPLIAAVEGSGMRRSIRNMMLGPVADQACDPARLQGLSDRDRALAQAECNAMKGAMSGGFPFGGDLSNMDRQQLDMMAAMNGMTLNEMAENCRGAAPADIAAWKMDMRAKVCRQVLAGVDVGAEGSQAGPPERLAARTPIPVARPDPAATRPAPAAQQVRSEGAEPPMPPGLDLTVLDLPNKVREMDPQKVWAKCHEIPPDSMSMTMKLFHDHICSKVKAAVN